jgi:DNA replicative helicase MCM subunit Mcm2 (Cdc46/Mcm family)
MSTLLMGLKGLHEDELLCVKELGPKSIGRLVMVRAIVVRVSEVIP